MDMVSSMIVIMFFISEIRIIVLWKLFRLMKVFSVMVDLVLVR